MGRKKKPPPREDAPAPRLADLLRASGLDVPEVAPTPPPPAATPVERSLAELLAAAGKPVLRKERKGRKGKTVTLVSGLGLEGDDLQRVGRALGKALGCGASVQGPDIVLQGNQRERAGAWLEAQRTAT